MFIDLMKNVRIFRDFSDGELGLICDIAAPYYFEFKKGDILVSQEEPFDKFGILVSGILQDIRYHIDGKSQLVRSHERFSVVNLEGATSRKKTSPTFIQATAGGRIVWFSYDALIFSEEMPLPLMRRLYVSITGFVADDSIRFMNKLDVLSRKDAIDRIMVFLSVLKRKSKTDYVDVGMNQVEFAEYLCMDKTTLNTALGKMRALGLLEYKRSRFWVHFPELRK
jgi:CRP-like cAMP-binding protein